MYFIKMYGNRFLGYFAYINHRIYNTKQYSLKRTFSSMKEAESVAEDIMYQTHGGILCVVEEE